MCLTEARVPFCLTLSIFQVNCAEVDSLISRDLRLVLSVFWLISRFACLKKGVNGPLGAAVYYFFNIQGLPSKHLAVSKCNCDLNL